MSYSKKKKSKSTLDAFKEFGKAWDEFFMALMKALKIDKLVRWLNDLLKG